MVILTGISLKEENAKGNWRFMMFVSIWTILLTLYQAVIAFWRSKHLAFLLMPPTMAAVAGAEKVLSQRWKNPVPVSHIYSVLGVDILSFIFWFSATIAIGILKDDSLHLVAVGHGVPQIVLFLITTITSLRWAHNPAKDLDGPASNSDPENPNQIPFASSTGPLDNGWAQPQQSLGGQVGGVVASGGVQVAMQLAS
ncbi:uncharacterized protein BDR25DRAFT_318814 [Lindgomyces ingoldianus]|uniref:Uncharacterized protein n=1 Tax=Lindgomyces ingoldianus TaxID=673940 RepID=A0ACB6QG53_9PLEO|nr:uncharacterized protein BDR25DRAFT_318814 [Lindgomyces ingoldianus]KAF2465125.1 hypothetical protein BDR25DRAFT_318814 [Lindgomyces ingoldianus]